MRWLRENSEWKKSEILNGQSPWEGHRSRDWTFRFCVVLKGRGFQPRRKACKMNEGFSR
jgi:hypothetical protein